MPAPFQVTIRAYQVGFGDCFLLTFHYESGGDRHVLIDFGSTGAPEGFGDLALVAKDIQERCGGKLHAVVATHRHKDHISGFATQEDRGGPGDVIASCEPDLIIQPWTEDPNLAPDAEEPLDLSSDHGRSKAFTRTLRDMQAVAGSILQEAERMQAEALENDEEEDGGDGPEPAEAAPGKRRISPLIRQLAFMGENNLSNLSAIKNLIRMSEREGAEARYVSFGSDSGLGQILPGVKVRVLGPPTLKQSSTIRKQRHRDETEFWHFQAQASQLASGPAAPLFNAPVYATSRRPKPSRWLLRRLHLIRRDQLREIVRILDKALNNTSVILLFEIGKQKLLFPGDAQIENWQYALSKPRIRKALEQVTFYKVGHHGSLNATPKSLWDSFAKRSRRKGPSRLRTIVSTMKGKHGDSRRDTEVPRKTLVQALKRESSFKSTQEIKVRDRVLFLEEVLKI